MTATTIEHGISADDPVQYLTFTLDGESFATDIAQVREVLEFKGVTKVPRTPDYMRGVINLRGSVVPVVDLRLQFGMESTEPTIDTCIVIIEVPIDAQPVVLGALADSVQEVLELKPEQLAPPPRFGTRIRTDFIRAMGRYGDQFVIILDMERVFSTEAIVEIGDPAQLLAEAQADESEAQDRNSKVADVALAVATATAAEAALHREAGG
ncbi:MAG: chemotaxis protein CheW [Gammaproteobacteria bacterium]|jgi:purine-binding chemotaxis protein CheW